MTQLKSQAHPEWPYSGTAHEWRGFVKSKGLIDRLTLDQLREVVRLEKEYAGSVLCAVYQKQNFGPELK